MSEQTKRTRVIVAVLAFVLAVGLLGYWLGRGAARPKQPPAIRSAADTSAVLDHPAPRALPKPRDIVAATPPDHVDAASIPFKWRFAGISQYRTGNDTEAWLAQFTEHHDLIVRFNQRYPYAWNVSSAEEIAWLARNGFPMPEDAIAADAMSDEDLRDAADAGSAKAQMFYFARLRDHWITAAREEIANGVPLADVIRRVADSMPGVAQETARIAPQINQLDTPFVGYMEATRLSVDDDPLTREQNFVSGLALAFARGDDRAALAILAGSANGELTEEQASLAYRIVTEMRNAYPANCISGQLTTPFPKPAY